MNKEQIILPFSDKPLNQMYHHNAFPIAIIQAYADKDLTPWLCQRYINCQFDSNEYANKFQICLTGHWGNLNNIFSYQALELTNEIFKKLQIDILHFFKVMLCHNWYIYGRYNEEFIPGKASYKKNYRSHDFLIFGFDDYEKVFYSAGFLKDGKFQKFKISYDNMYKAIITLEDRMINFSLRSYNKDWEFTFELTRVIKYLEDYLLSRESFEKYSPTTVYGLEAMEMLKVHFLKEAKSKKEFDHRYSRGIMEHKFFLKMLIQYLNDVGILNDYTYIEIANNIYKKAERMHLLGIKYSMNKKYDIVEYITNDLTDIINEEREYLTLVLADMKNHTKEGIKNV